MIIFTAIVLTTCIAILEWMHGNPLNTLQLSQLGLFALIVISIASVAFKVGFNNDGND